MLGCSVAILLYALLCGAESVEHGFPQYPEYPAYGTSPCTSLKNCDSNGAWGQDQSIVHPQAPCQLQADCMELLKIDESVPVDAHVLMIRSSFFTSLSYDDMRNLTELVQLQIEYNDLQMIEAGAFRAQGKLETLLIEGNNLSTLQVGTFTGLGKLGELRMQYNSIRNVSSGSFTGLSKATAIDLSWNSLQELIDDIFAGAPALRTLNLQGNNISYIAPNAFRNLPGLETLNLQLNFISRIPTEQLKPLPRLATLNLAKNPITAIERASFKGMRALTRLYMNGCDIASVAKRAFNNKKLLELSLSFNLIRTLPNLGRMPRLTSLDLSDNPWQCDCAAVTTSKWLRRTGFGNKSLVCKSPSHLAGRNMLQLSAETLCSLVTPRPIPPTPYGTDAAPTESTPLDDVTSAYIASSFGAETTTGLAAVEEDTREEASGDYYYDPVVYKFPDVVGVVRRPTLNGSEKAVQSRPVYNRTRPSHKPSAPPVSHKVDTPVIVAIVVTMAFGVGAIAAMVSWRIASRCQRRRRHSFQAGVEIALSGTATSLSNDKIVRRQAVRNGKHRRPDEATAGQNGTKAEVNGEAHSKGGDVNDNGHVTMTDVTNAKEASTNGSTHQQSNGHTPKL